MTFVDFLKRFKNERGWIGDFANDALKDSGFPDSIETQRSLSKYLNSVGAIQEAKVVGKALMSLYLIKVEDGSIYGPIKFKR